jgi:hypothetical protein
MKMTINDQYELWPGVKWPEPWQETAECVDCRWNAVRLGEWYMVHDSVWKAAGMETMGGALCIGCLEERLGRHLTADDFMDVPLNDLSIPNTSSRLRAALLRKSQWGKTRAGVSNA